eukprot:4528790-Amphidinium_carterae.1
MCCNNSAYFSLKSTLLSRFRTASLGKATQRTRKLFKCLCNHNSMYALLSYYCEGRLVLEPRVSIGKGD